MLLLRWSSRKCSYSGVLVLVALFVYSIFESTRYGFAASLLAIPKVIEARARGSERNRTLRAGKRYWYEGKRRKRKRKKRERESIREQSEKSQHIAVRPRESECVEEMICICAYKKERERERETPPLERDLPLKRFLFALVKYGSSTVLHPFYLFTQTPFQLFALGNRARYIRTRETTLSPSLVFNHFLCGHGHVSLRFFRR